MSPPILCPCKRETPRERAPYKGVQRLGWVDTSDGVVLEAPLVLLDCACGSTQAASLQALLHDDEGVR